MDLQVLLHSEKKTHVKNYYQRAGEKEFLNANRRLEVDLNDSLGLILVQTQKKNLKQPPMRVKILELREASGQMKKRDISPPAGEKKRVVIIVH